MTGRFVLGSRTVMKSPREFTSPLDRRDDEQSAGGMWVPRFGLTERFAHWWTMAMVSAALLTGIVMGDDGGPVPSCGCMPAQSP